MIEPVARLRIELREIEPKVWRRVDDLVGERLEERVRAPGATARGVGRRTPVRQ